MKKIILTILAVSLLTSCYNESVSREYIGDFKVEFLFEKDGVKVYRFYDNSSAHYFTNKGGETITTQSNGKNSSEENIN